MDGWTSYLYEDLDMHDQVNCVDGDVVGVEISVAILFYVCMCSGNLNWMIGIYGIYGIFLRIPYEEMRSFINEGMRNPCFSGLCLACSSAVPIDSV